MYLPPPILMEFNISSVVVLERWTNYISGDPYKNIPYKWTVTLSITAQRHGDKFTNTAYAYNGLDITPGMWISNKVGGYVYKVINVQPGATASTVVLDIEDVDRFNLSLDPSRTGASVSPKGGAVGFIFELNDSGEPIFPGITSGIISPSFQADLQSRFAYRNEALQYIRVSQPGHTFVIGDIISPDPANTGLFKLATASQELSAIGTITDINIPSTDYFNYKPFGKILYNLSPAFTGNYGDIYYLDPANPGKLTTTRPSNHSKPIYIQIDSTTGIVLDDNSSDSPVKYIVDTVSNGQTTFQLPAGALDVLEMTINGIETDNYTFNSTSSILTFDPVKNGYGVDSSDEVVITYKV